MQEPCETLTIVGVLHMLGVTAAALCETCHEKLCTFELAHLKEEEIDILAVF